ncbi:hypothetical protein PGT21_030052 [Puccinia graminis f. sp. tritici]|uniref:Uncharacterized protein n=1 Tax=Puccinia graminis f. sp. tritici TaxID=56615 RepID=A0A5B0Q6Z9_PUCGR|nr:hypothetical protein PGT21_030052 [Puccinia graminis f. sp. tritici]
MTKQLPVYMQKLRWLKKKKEKIRSKQPPTPFDQKALPERELGKQHQHLSINQLFRVSIRAPHQITSASPAQPTNNDPHTSLNTLSRPPSSLWSTKLST